MRKTIVFDCGIEISKMSHVHHSRPLPSQQGLTDLRHTNIGPYRASIAAKKEEIESNNFLADDIKDNRSALQFSKSIIQ